MKLPPRGDLIVGQEYTDFDKGLDDGIEGEVFGFNFLLAPANGKTTDRDLVHHPGIIHNLVSAERRNLLAPEFNYNNHYATIQNVYPKQAANVYTSALDHHSVDYPSVEHTSINQPSLEDSSVNYSYLKQPTLQQPIVQESFIQKPTLQQFTLQETSLQQPTLQQTTLQQSTLQQLHLNHGGNSKKFEQPQKNFEQNTPSQLNIPTALGYFTLDSMRQPKGFFDHFWTDLMGMFKTPAKTRLIMPQSHSHFQMYNSKHTQQPVNNRIKNRRVSNDGKTVQNEILTGKPLGLILVELGYNKCSLGRGAPFEHEKLLISWTKTPVRVFGGAILKTIPPFC